MIRLPAYHVTKAEFDGLISITCSNGQVCTTADYHEALRFLLDSAGNVPYDVPRVVWKLDELINALMVILPDHAVKGLDSDDHRATWSEREMRYRLFLQPGKFFGLHAGGFGMETTYYELDQFFPEYREMQSIDDVKAAAEELVLTAASIGVKNIKDLKSPVAMIEASGLMEQVYKQLPGTADIPAGAMEYAEMTDAWGAWTSAYQIGYWPEVFTYDVASCYPSIAARLPSLDGAKYEYVKKEIPADAKWGFMKGELTIDPDHPLAWCSPVVAPVGDDVGNPVGVLPGFFTLAQVRYIIRHGMGNFNLKDGWFVTPQSDKMPFKDVMNQYYQLRKGGDLTSMLCKRVINGLIGRLGQYIKDEPTPYTNPIYHSTIRNGASLLVGEFIVHNEITQDELLHVNTDGIRITRKLSLPDTNGMGKWRSHGQHATIILAPDKVLEGEACNAMLDAVRANKRATIYHDTDMWRIAAEQDRYFERYPSTGGDLLKKQYMSQPLVV